MSLNESRDAAIVRIDKNKSSHNHIIAEVVARVDESQRSLFLRNSELLKWDGRSTLARFGFNVAPTGDFTWENGNLITSVEIYNFIPEYFPESIALDQFFETGVPVGKYFLDDESRYLSASALNNLIESRHLITGKGAEVIDTSLHGILRIPLQPVVYRPSKNYSEQALRDIIHKRVPRGRLTKYQEPVNVDELIVPSDSGIVALSPLLTNLEVIVQDPSDSNVKHTEARMGSQYTRWEFFLEYIGNGKQDSKLESVELILSEPRQEKFRVYVPISLDSGANVSLEDNRSLENHIQKFELPGDNLRFIEYIDFSDKLPGLYRRISRGELTAQRDFYEDFQNNKDVALIFNQFPGQVGTESTNGISDFLIRLSKEDVLKTVYLNNAPNGIFFSESSLEDLNRMWENGTTIYWRNESNQNWRVYNSGFWVKPEKLQEFVDYHKSGKLVAFYGSSKKIDGDLNQIVDQALENILRFHGGKVGFITGGWGEKDSFMESTSKNALDKNILVGAVFWNVSGQESYAEVDFAQYYDETHLNPRQELLARSVEAEFYGDGGVGTRLEFYNTLTNQKIGIGARKPVILLGEEAGTLKEEVQKQVKKGLTPKELLNNIYVVTKNNENDVYQILCEHFKTGP